MPLKKKTTVAKTSARNEPEPAVNRDGSRRRPVASPSEAGAAAAAEARSLAEAQLKTFEQAIHLFNARKFAQARELFAKAAAGPNKEMAHNADLHVRMCDSRLEKPVVQLKTVEELYNYGVAMINTRNLPDAQHHLETALKLAPEADYVYYALALCRGLAGDLDGAHENLKRAIELEPRNRISARQDADFAGIINQPQIQQLLFPEKTGTG